MRGHRLRSKGVLLALLLVVISAPGAVSIAFADTAAGASCGSFGASEPYQVSTASDLRCIESHDLSADYVLVSDIDLGGTSFDPIGEDGAPFNGSFDGNGHTIENLVVSESGTDGVGLFGVIDSGGVEDLQLTGVSVSGGDKVGGLGGEVSANVDNVFVSGSVTGNDSVGGLVGEYDGTSNLYISGSTANVNVDGATDVGGLVGHNRNELQSIRESTASGDVVGENNVGGLVGRLEAATETSNVDRTGATGDVEATDADGTAGGLVGKSGAGRIYHSYASGAVSGTENVGGLVGTQTENHDGNGAGITDSYANGSVTGQRATGGLVGYNDGGIHTSYAVGTVTGTETGGLTGDNEASVEESYWDTQTTGQSTGTGIGGVDTTTAGLTTAEMQGVDARDNMDGFLFPSASTIPWRVQTDDYPALGWQGVPPIITDVDATNPSGQSVSIVVNSTDRLETMEVSVTGPDGTTTHEKIDFDDDPYVFTGGKVYTLGTPYDTGADGTYTVTVENATNYEGIDGANGESDTVTVGTATPTPDAVVSPGTVDFGSSLVGGSSTATVTVTNDGTAPLDVTGLSIAGSHASGFTIDSGGATVLAPDASTDVVVEFAPTADGTRTADLTVATNDTDRTVTLTGSGTPTPAYFSVTIDSTNAPITEGETLSVDATVENVGNTQGTQTVSLSMDGTQSDSVTETLGGGQSKTMTLSWYSTPGVTGSHTATVATADDAASTGVTVQTAGTSFRGCLVITSEGRHTLAGDVQFAGDQPCIEVRASNVTVDGQGHAITGPHQQNAAWAGTGVLVNASAGADENVTVRNVAIRNVTDAVRLDGQGEEGVTDVTVAELATDYARTGVNVTANASGTLDGLIVHDGDFRLEDDALELRSNRTDATVRDVRVANNTVETTYDRRGGIDTTTGSLVAFDVDQQPGQTVRNLTLVNNTATVEDEGIDVVADEDGATIRELTLRDNDLLGGGVDLDYSDQDTTLETVTIEDNRISGRIQFGGSGERTTTSDLTVVGNELEDLHVEYDDTDAVLETVRIANNNFEGWKTIEIDGQGERSELRDLSILNNDVEATLDGIDINYRAGEASDAKSVHIVNNAIGANGDAIVYDAGERSTSIDVVVRGNSIEKSDRSIQTPTYQSGIRFDVGYDDAVTENLRIVDNVIESNHTSLSFQADPFDGNATVRDATIGNNTISSNRTAMELQLWEKTSTFDVAVVGNRITDFGTEPDPYAGDPGIFLQVQMDGGTDVDLVGNVITNRTGTVDGIVVETMSDDETDNGTLAIEHNVVRTAGDAIVLNEVPAHPQQRWRPGPVDTVDVHRNVLDATGEGIDNHNNRSAGQGRPWVDATHNYWAAADGPASVVPLADPVTGAAADGSGSGVTSGNASGMANVHFDPWLASAPSANFTVALAETSTPVTEGETLSVDATVTNRGVGHEAVTRTVTLSAGGTQHGTETVTLRPGETETVTVDWSTGAGDAGTYSGVLATANHSRTTAFTIEPSSGGGSNGDEGNANGGDSGTNDGGGSADGGSDDGDTGSSDDGTTTETASPAATPTDTLTPTLTATPTESTTESSSTVDGGGEPPSTDAETTAETGPGFGVLATLLAGTVALILARRTGQ